MEYSAARFIHERDAAFHASPEVEAVVSVRREDGDHIPNEPTAKITAHLGYTANRELVGHIYLPPVGDNDQAKADRASFTERFVIKADEVPETYFELQRRIAREQGHGDIHLGQELRSQIIESVQADQRGGLRKWTEYLASDDAAYPDWFTTYAFSSVTKLGAYNKEKGEFGRRSKGTTSPYPELNHEALAYVYDTLDKARIKGEAVTGSVDNDKLQKLLKSANFGKLYAYAMLEVTPASAEEREQTDGQWKVYSQGDNPAVGQELAASLQGHCTGWCTAGESVAASQLNMGDFHVYYSYDENSEATVPRVAIRMQHGSVVEVRGINKAQELEPVMADIALAQLKDLPGGESYTKKAEDMKRLTALENRLQNDPRSVQLSDQELRFLYELDNTIEGFGYDRDPRIDALKKLRGEQDMPELARILPETIREKLYASIAGYKNVMQTLGHEVSMSDADIETEFAEWDTYWRKRGAYDYVVEKFKESGMRHNLVITPNILVDSKDIANLAREFGKGQPHETYVYEEMWLKDNYSELQMSGELEDGPIRFSLMPAGRDPHFSGTVEQQNHKLHLLQWNKRNIRFFVPSPLEAISNWFALRASGDKLTDSNAFDKTFVRHFNLPAIEVGGWSYVLHSCVDDGGKPYLNFSGAEVENGGCVAVG